MTKIKIEYSKKVYIADDEKIYLLLKILGYKGEMIWKEKIISNYRIYPEKIITLLKKYKLYNGHFFKNMNKL